MNHQLSLSLLKNRGDAYGYCQCGCGQKTPLSKNTSKARGLVKGQPTRFILGHQVPTGESSVHWKGGSWNNGDGYVVVTAKGHPRADPHGRIFEHILIAEQALGRHLPPGAQVHHTDEQCGRINPRGLVICPDGAYHQLLHKRSRALDACGNANWRKCKYCKVHDDPANLHISGLDAYHRSCKNERRNQSNTGRSPGPTESNPQHQRRSETMEGEQTQEQQTTGGAGQQDQQQTGTAGAEGAAGGEQKTGEETKTE